MKIRSKSWEKERLLIVSVCKTLIMWNASDRSAQSSYAQAGYRLVHLKQHGVAALMHIYGTEWCAWCNMQHSALALQVVQTKKRNKRAMNSSKIVILCESPAIFLHIKYYNGISSWREFYHANCHKWTWRAVWMMSGEWLTAAAEGRWVSVNLNLTM